MKRAMRPRARVCARIPIIPAAPWCVNQDVKKYDDNDNNDDDTTGFSLFVPWDSWCRERYKKKKNM
jgi:hypothetical protein